MLFFGLYSKTYLSALSRCNRVTAHRATHTLDPPLFPRQNEIFERHFYLRYKQVYPTGSQIGVWDDNSGEQLRNRKFYKMGLKSSNKIINLIISFYLQKT